MDKFTLLRQASELSHPRYGAWLFDTWEGHNQAYFAGKLEVIPIIWGLTPHGHTLGYFSPTIPRITLHESLVSPQGDAWGIRRILGERFASDVLLHEMIHQSIHQRLGHDGCGERKPGWCTSHNNPHWVAEVNRIAPLLGLRANAVVIRQARVKEPGAPGKGKVTWYTPDGYMTRDELSHWPHSVRPDGYYEPEAQELVEISRAS